MACSVGMDLPKGNDLRTQLHTAKVELQVLLDELRNYEDLDSMAKEKFDSICEKVKVKAGLGTFGFQLRGARFSTK